jgi:hypothetical protein
LSLSLLALPACAQNSGKSSRVIEPAPKSRPAEQEPYDAPKSRPAEQEPYDAPKSRPAEQEEPTVTGGGRGGDLAGVILSDGERRILYDIFGGGHHIEGFKKPKPLPPGIQKKIARGGAIPPGIAMTRLPNSVYGRLPGRRSGDLVAVGNDIVLIDPTTRVILDIVEGVLR